MSVHAAARMPARGVKPRGKAAALAAPARAIRNADDGAAPGARLPRGVWPQVPGSRCCGVMSPERPKGDDSLGPLCVGAEVQYRGQARAALTRDGIGVLVLRVCGLRSGSCACRSCTSVNPGMGLCSRARVCVCLMTRIRVAATCPLARKPEPKRAVKTPAILLGEKCLSTPGTHCLTVHTRADSPRVARGCLPVNSAL